MTIEKGTKVVYYAVCDEKGCKNSTIDTQLNTKVALEFLLSTRDWFKGKIRGKRKFLCPEHHPKKTPKSEPFSDKEREKLKPLIIERRVE